jgi:(R,R)-butanediol dehydrogenase/meso-butanediol dehydrogenase/diacetyl reductase
LIDHGAAGRRTIAAMTADTMPAAVYVGDGRIEVQRLPVPVPGSAQALIEVSHCGICGTDLHLIHDQYGRPGSVLGHEWSGTVVGVGSDVDGWPLGTEIVSNPASGCGHCRACRRGRPSVCRRLEATDYLGFNGAFCRYKLVDASRLLRLPAGLSMRAAALAEPTAIAIHAVSLAQVEPDDRVLITGGGAVGLLILAVLRARGITNITVSEPAPLRQARAADLGATVVTPGDLPAAAMGLIVENAFDVAFECSGHASAAEAALDQLDFAGTLVFVGTGGAPPRINHNRMIILELSVIGTYNYDADGFGSAIDLLASGVLPIDLLIAPDDVRLDGLQDVIGRLVRGEIPGKVMVRPEVST